MYSRPDSQHPAAWWVFAAAQAIAITAANALGFSVAAALCAALLVNRFAYSELARRNFRLIAMATLALIGLRVIFQNLFGYPMGSHVILHLPSAQLPSWLAGIRLGGAITSESLLFALNDGTRIAAIALTFAAIASITSPTRVLRALPVSLHSAGMLLVIAVTFLPHLLADVSRIRNAARWRGQRVRGLRTLSAQLINVAESALDRSVTLAAALNTRGYIQSAGSARLRAGLLIGSILLLSFTTSTITFGISPVTVIGSGLSLALMWMNLDASNRETTRTRYRPDEWAPRDTSLVAIPVIAGAIIAADTSLWPAAATLLAVGLAILKGFPTRSNAAAVTS